MIPTTHVFIATSLDGYIARIDGDIQWLLDRDDPSEDHGYAAFIADKDLIVMGRGTFEKVAGLEKWPYDRPVLVLSTQLADTPVPDSLKGKVSFSGQSIAALMEALAKQGVRRVYADGGILIQSFLRAGLVSDMTITTVPVLIGAGRSLFSGEWTHDINLELVFSRSFASGLVQTKYKVRA